MKCSYCGEKFKGEDLVITLKSSGELLHDDGDCLVNHIFENYGDAVLTYLEYLEEKVM